MCNETSLDDMFTTGLLAWLNKYNKNKRGEKVKKKTETKNPKTKTEHLSYEKVLELIQF